MPAQTYPTPRVDKMNATRAKNDKIRAAIKAGVTGEALEVVKREAEALRLRLLARYAERERELAAWRTERQAKTTTCEVTE